MSEKDGAREHVPLCLCRRCIREAAEELRPTPPAPRDETRCLCPQPCQLHYPSIPGDVVPAPQDEAGRCRNCGAGEHDHKVRPYGNARVCPTYDPALPPPDDAEPLIRRIEGFARLERNWDTYNAEPTHPKAIEVALALARAYKWHHVVPTNDGGVAFSDESETLQVEISYVGE